MIGLQNGFLIREFQHLLLLIAIHIMEIYGIFAIAKALAIYNLTVPNGVQVGVLTKPLHLNRIATFVIQMRHMHRAKTIGIEVNVEDKGIVALLLRVLSSQKPEDILDSELYFIDSIGLKEHLSPTRSNGLVAMVK